MELWETLLGGDLRVIFREDKQAMVRIVEAGCNLAVRYLSVAHGISVAWLREAFKCDELALACEVRSLLEKSALGCAL